MEHTSKNLQAEITKYFLKQNQQLLFSPHTLWDELVNNYSTLSAHLCN